MCKFLKNLFCLLLVLFAFSSCQKKAMDDFYGRPETLAPPIYQVLQSRGNFTNLLACIDKSDYSSILKSQGYWTLFAPNDAAFTAFFADPANIAKGITNISQIDVATANKIVSYSLVYNAAKTDHIADYQASTGYQTNQAFKRRTAYHANTDTVTINAATVPALQPQLLNQKIYVVDINNNFGTYFTGEFNNKYIPYFTGSPNPNFLSGGYFGRLGLTAAKDYNSFYPNSLYTGFNVVDGSVVNADISCENGVIHEINTVVTPLPNLDKYLAGNPLYSHFKKLYDQFMVQYVPNTNFTTLNQIQTGSSVPVYVKSYPSLGFNINNESYQTPGTASQTASYGLLAPDNTTFDKYVNEVLLEHFPSVDKLPINVVTDFLSSHMFASAVPLWPSLYKVTSNVLGEPDRVDISPNSPFVFDRKVCSNGFFYGTTKINEPNAFSTVYGRVYLDPNYSMMKTILDVTGMKNNLILPGFNYTVILLSDKQLTAAGFSYNTSTNSFSYVAPPGGYTTNLTAQQLLSRIVAMGIFRTDNGELNNVSGSGIYETAGLGGNAPEYVKFSNNQFFAVGNVEANSTVPVKVSTATPNPSPKQTTNGITYYTSDTSPLLLPTSATPLNAAIGQALAKYGTNPTDPYYMFFQYLKNNTALYSGGVISGVDASVPFTVLVPTNAAIQDAINNGWLPGNGTGAVKTPLFTPTATADISLVTNFMKYHFIKGFTVVPDGKKSGPAFSTLLFNSNGDQVNLNITNTGLNNMKVIDGNGRTANVANQSTSTLANYAVIQTIDTYLQYIDPYSNVKY